MQPVIFVSYSHRDSEEKDRLLSYLRVLQNIGLTDPWSDERIAAGSNWFEEISQAVNQARVAILLVTVNYLDSEFIRGRELPLLLDRSKNEGLIVFPIIAKACPWKRVGWLEGMQVRPRDGNPVWADHGSHVDEDLTAIVDEIADILERPVPSSQATATSSPAPLAPAVAELPSQKKVAARKLLIVENDEAFRRSVKLALKEENLVFFEADTVEGAADILEKDREIQVILLDLDLGPGGQGTSLLEQIKEQASKYRVIILTGHPEMMAARIAKQYEVFDYRAKAQGYEDEPLRFAVNGAFKDIERSHAQRAGEGERFSELVLNSYPTPFTFIYQELEGVLPSVKRFLRIIDMFELLLHFSALVLIAEYLNRSTRIADLDKVIRERIKKPSLGDWFNLTNEIFKRKKELPDFFFLDRFAALFKGKNRQAMARMIEARNDHLGHSAAHRDYEYQELAADCWQVVTGLLSDFQLITEFILCNVLNLEKRKGHLMHRLIELRGRNYHLGVSERQFDNIFDSKVVHLIHLETENFQNLHPFVVLEHCSQCNQTEIFFYTKFESDKLQYISYSSGHKIYVEQNLSDLTDLLGN
jgi:ActR/RegA family two-component response regulator